MTETTLSPVPAFANAPAAFELTPIGPRLLHPRNQKRRCLPEVLGSSGEVAGASEEINPVVTVAPITTITNPLETFERIVRLYIHAQ